MVPRLQVATKIPPSTIDEPLCLEPPPKPSAKDVKSEPVSLEMFNRAASDLNTKGIINLKKYNCYLETKNIQTYMKEKMSCTVNNKLPEALFIDTLTEKVEMLKKYLKDVSSQLVLCANIGPNMAMFKFFTPQEEDSLKLHYTFSSLGDLKEQLFYLWVQLNYLLRSIKSYIKG